MEILSNVLSCLYWLLAILAVLYFVISDLYENHLTLVQDIITKKREKKYMDFLRKKSELFELIVRCPRSYYSDHELFSESLARFLLENGVVIKENRWRKKMIKNFLKILLAVLWCLADPKKATEAANEAATIEEFDAAMMKQMGGFL